MIPDIISDRLFQIDNYARDARGNINEDDKLNQFIDNIINDASLDPSFGEDYIDYSIRNINNEYIKKLKYQKCINARAIMSVVKLQSK